MCANLNLPLGIVMKRTLTAIDPPISLLVVRRIRIGGATELSNRFVTYIPQRRTNHAFTKWVNVA
jgi:hypothetical protein